MKAIVITFFSAIIAAVIVVKSPYLLTDLSIFSNHHFFIKLAGRFNKNIDEKSLINFIVSRKKFAHLSSKEIRLIKKMVGKGFDINAQDIHRNKNTALISSTEKYDLNAVTFLLNMGALPNIENNNGNTAATVVCLKVPIQKEGEQILEVLYKNRANLEHVNKEGYSCLTYAKELVKKVKTIHTE